MLVLVFISVFIQGLICFISVECILFRFSWNVNLSLAFKSISFSISFWYSLVEVLSWGG